MTIVPFKKPEQPERWLEGSAKCVGCQHAWHAAAPTGTTWLECPSCGSMRGAWVHPVGAQEGDIAFVCNCGGEAVTAYKRAGHFWLICMACGIDQTNAIFGE